MIKTTRNIGAAIGVIAALIVGVPSFVIAASSFSQNNLIQVGPHSLIVPTLGFGFVATSTTQVFINGNRTDTYTADGTYLFPYKSITAANSAVTAANLSSAAYWITPGTYVEQSMTLPNIPIVIYGNGATIILANGASLGTGTMTIPNDIDFYDPSIVGNVVVSDASATNPHSINNGFIAGNLTTSGNFTMDNTAIVDQNQAVFPFLAASASSTILVQAGSIADFGGDPIQVVITNKGFLNLDNDGVLNIATSTRYAIDSSTAGSQLAINGATIQNFGTGGGINCANGATTVPNEMSNFSVTVGVGTSNAVACGSAVTFITGYVANTVTGTRLYASGTALSALSQTGLGIEGLGAIGSTTPTLSTAQLTLGVDSNASSATTTISMGKIQFDGYNSAGTRYCVQLIGTAFATVAGACNP